MNRQMWLNCEKNAFCFFNFMHFIKFIYFEFCSPVKQSFLNILVQLKYVAGLLFLLLI